MPAPTSFAIRHPRITLFVALAMVAAAAPGLAKLRLRTDGHALVPHNAPQVQTDRALRADFGLTDTIVVVLRHDTPEGIFHAQTIQHLAALTRALQRIEGIRPDDVTSLATEKSHRVLTGTLNFLDMLDPMPQTVEQLATLRDDVRRIDLYSGTLVSRDQRAAAIYVGVRESADRLPIYHRILRVISESGINPDDIHVTGAPVAESLLGSHILEDLGVPVAMLDDQFVLQGDQHATMPRTFEELRLFIARHVGLLPIAIAVMTAVFWFAFRSLTAVALTWLKTVACLIIVFGLMGWVGSPIYLTTAVIPIILIAIGVSDEIHLFSRYARQLAATDVDRLPPSGADVRATAQAAMMEALQDVRRPIVMTSITTATAFLSFALSPITPVSAFGYFTALGAMVCLAWALTATPAAAMLVHPRRFLSKRSAAVIADAARERQGPDRAGDPSPIAWIGLAVARRPRRVLLAVVLLLGAAGLGIARIHIQDSWIDGFSPASRFYRDTQLFNREFLGMHILYVCADAGNRKLNGVLDEAAVDHFAIGLPANAIEDPAALVGQQLELSRDGQPPADVVITSPVHVTRIKSAARQGDRIVVGMDRGNGSPRFTMAIQKGETIRFQVVARRYADPATLRLIGDLEHFLTSRTDDKIGGAIGPAAYIETTNYLAGGRRTERRTIPNDAKQLDYVWKWFANIRGNQRMHATVDADFSRAVISVYMNNANFRDTARLLDAIRDYERKHLTPAGISLSFAGDVAVSQALIAAIVSTEVRSVTLSLLGVLILCILLTRSLKWGLLAILPCLLAVPMNFALMGWFGIPLGVATSMFTAMTIGIGVDYAIHFVERYRLALAQSADAQLAIASTFSAAGRSIVVDALSVGLGFSVLILSQVPANARLAIMVVASIATCLLATLLVLPAALTSRGLKAH